MTPRPGTVLRMLTNSQIPVEQRRDYFLALVRDAPPEISSAIVERLLSAPPSGLEQAVVEEKLRELQAELQVLSEGPRRDATFVGWSSTSGPTTYATVVFADGTRASVPVADRDLEHMLEIEPGASVLVAAQGAMLGVDDSFRATGETARFVRVIDEHRIEVALRAGSENHVYHASAALRRQLQAQALAEGAPLLVSARRAVAFEALPARDRNTSRFAGGLPLPPVRREDFSELPPLVAEIERTLRMELAGAPWPRRYALPRARLLMLAGPSGAGKTYTLDLIHRVHYEVVSEVCGIPVESIPPLVMTLRAPAVLSKWLGESDRNIDEFFDELAELALRTLPTIDGRLVHLPLLVKLEEVDGLGAARGREQIYDRLMSTLLERLDPARLRELAAPILVISTSNHADMIDAALKRRLTTDGVHLFGRLNRLDLASVLGGKIRNLPVALGRDGGSAPEARSRIVADAAGLLWAPSDAPIVEIDIAGANPLRKHRRDFLTAGVVAQAVDRAARAACLREADGEPDPGLTPALVLDALEHEILAITSVLEPANVRHFVDLPDGVRVLTVRRLARRETGGPNLHPHHFERRSA